MRALPRLAMPDEVVTIRVRGARKPVTSWLRIYTDDQLPAREFLEMTGPRSAFEVIEDGQYDLVRVIEPDKVEVTLYHQAE